MLFVKYAVRVGTLDDPKPYLGADGWPSKYPKLYDRRGYAKRLAQGYIMRTRAGPCHIVKIDCTEVAG
jgi:hypothetical protein